MRGWCLGLCALIAIFYGFFAETDWKQHNRGWFYGDIALAVFCIIVVSIVFIIAARRRGKA